MSEPIPESIPTSADRRSRRPLKKQRGPVTPSSQQSAQVEALFADPDREIVVPSGPAPRVAPLPPEIVANVQGSSAGAGSGEFHVYKASRRREYERLRLMDEEVEREEKDRAWREKQDERKKTDEEKLSRNQAKRAKMKARKEKAKIVGGGDVEEETSENGGGKPAADGVMKKLGRAKVAFSTNRGENEMGRAADANETGNRTGDNEPTVDEGGITFHDTD